MTPTVPHLLYADNDKHIYTLFITRRILGVKETARDYVPVDSESVTHKIWVLRIKSNIVFVDYLF